MSSEDISEIFGESSIHLG